VEACHRDGLRNLPHSFDASIILNLNADVVLKNGGRFTTPKAWSSLR
jgi:hypothetical protein